MSVSSPTRTRPPRGVCARIAVRLAMVPLGVRHAAAFPSTAAAYSSRARTVGSSPYTSSPSRAVVIARRIAGVGSVNVSLRSSITVVLLVVDADPDVLVGQCQAGPDRGVGRAGRDEVAEPLARVARRHDRLARLGGEGPPRDAGYRPPLRPARHPREPAPPPGEPEPEAGRVPPHPAAPPRGAR